jgi:hydroxymethylpyrimidine/phosphomethylpyrimidine kinase
MANANIPAHWKPVRTLSIAGSDSGGGAGIQADIKTITMMGGHAMTAITAITAQNSQGVTAAKALAPELVVAQVDAVISDFGVDAIKIGMLGSPDIADAVAETLEQHPQFPVVFDPVMVATSGAVLADDKTIGSFARLIRRATLVTPNRQELEALGGPDAFNGHGCALLEKGGHDDGDTLTDILRAADGKEIHRWTDTRIDSPHTHGTGCTLSSAIATGLGQGLGLIEAVSRARLVVRLAIHDAPQFVAQNGPMGHGRTRGDLIQSGPLLNQITLGCSDYAASVAFYRLLGLAQIVDSPPFYARFETPNGTTFSLHESQAPPGDALVYFECDDLDKQCALLAEAGIVIDQTPRDESWRWREARLRDPFGNRLCLYFAGENRRHPPWRTGHKPVRA